MDPGLLLGLMPVLTSHHAQEARPYTLTVLLAASSTFALLRALEGDRARWWVGYGVATACLRLTHFLALSVVAAHLAAVLAVGDRRMAASWAVTTAIAVLPSAAVVLVSLGQGGVWNWIAQVRNTISERVFKGDLVVPLLESR